MLRILTALVAVGLLAGCSSTTTDAPSPTPTPSEATGFFTQSDTDALNDSYGAYPTAFTAATNNKAIKKCNALRTQGGDVWANCWKQLLTPVEKAVLATAAGMKDVASDKQLNVECREELESVAGDFTAHRSAIADLIKKYDGDPAAQAKAAKSYYKTLTENDQAISDNFKAITQVCYSPEDLVKIEASQSASPSS